MHANARAPISAPAVDHLGGIHPSLRRILVADDDRSIRQFNAMVLRSAGYEVDVSADGTTAWRALNTDRYDLLVTDHDMPDISGVELVKKLHTAHMAMPVILVSGMVPTGELARHPWLRIAAILLKPYAIAEFAQAVRAALHASPVARGAFASPADWQHESIPSCGMDDPLRPPRPVRTGRG